ncbi:MAG: hypothetical protein ABI130_14470 [Leifsonia sp.]
MSAVKTMAQFTTIQHTVDKSEDTGYKRTLQLQERDDQLNAHARSGYTLTHTHVIVGTKVDIFIDTPPPSTLTSVPPTNHPWRGVRISTPQPSRKERTMNLYTPVEIITAGVNDTRETFAHLYVELDALRAAAAYYYHLAFVDNNVDTEPSGRLPFHPAPAGFGGNEVAIPVRRVRLDRISAAGFELYAHGVRTALNERDQLLEELEVARQDLERMLDAMDGTRRHIVAEHLRSVDVQEHRRRVHATPAHQVTSWGDVPVRIPGTTDYTS